MRTLANVSIPAFEWVGLTTPCEAYEHTFKAGAVVHHWKVGAHSTGQHAAFGGSKTPWRELQLRP
jgi:hypothetical protein